MLEEIDPVRRVRPERDRRGLSVHGNRPRQLLVAEIFRYADREHAVLPTGLEMRRLAVIGAARFDPVVRPDGDVRVDLVAIVVTEQEDD
jgi:hypothetical protein